MSSDTPLQGTFLRSTRDSSGYRHLEKVDVAPLENVGIKCEHGCWAERSGREYGTTSFYTKYYYCSSGHQAPADLMTAALQSGDRELIDNPNKLHEREWYHVSNKPPEDFKECLHNQCKPFLHLGSRDAAIDRDLLMSQNLNTLNTAVPTYMYKVTLRPSNWKINEAVFVETDFDDEIEIWGHPSPEEDPRYDIDNFGVSRYINVREDPGSVSLIVKSGLIDPEADVELIDHAPATNKRVKPAPKSSP